MSKKISRRGLLIGGGAATALVVGGAFGLEHINVPWVPSNGFTGHIQNIIRADSAVVDSTVTGKYGESFLNHTKKMEITGKITFTKDLDKDRLHRTYQQLTMRVAKNMVSSAELQGGIINIAAESGGTQIDTLDTLKYLVEMNRAPEDQLKKIREEIQRAESDNKRVDLKFYSTLTPDKGY